MRDNNTTKWSEGLKFVAHMMNAREHSGIGRSPYEACFGRKMKMGLATSLPGFMVDHLQTEEDVEEFLATIRDES
jgi:hypothetical protein